MFAAERECEKLVILTHTSVVITLHHIKKSKKMFKVYWSEIELIFVSETQETQETQAVHRRELHLSDFVAKVESSVILHAWINNILFIVTDIVSFILLTADIYTNTLTSKLVSLGTVNWSNWFKVMRMLLL